MREAGVIPWHSTSAAEELVRLESSADGIVTGEAHARQPSSAASFNEMSPRELFRTGFGPRNQLRTVGSFIPK